MLLDTNVIVDLFRGYKPAELAFQKLLFGQKTSTITKLELIIGERSKQKIKGTLKKLEVLGIEFLPITPEIGDLTEKILSNYYHSHGIGIMDAIIASTAIVYDEELVTQNTKHFSFIPNLKLLKPY